MRRHYHVLTGNPGCMPDDNQIFTSRRAAATYAAHEAAAWLDMQREAANFGRRNDADDPAPRKLGSARSGLIQIQSGWSRAYNFEIEACDDPACMDNDDA